MHTSNRGRFPNDLTNQVTRDGQDPVASGGFADIYRGTLQDNGQPTRVAIKAIKTYSCEDGNISKKQKRLRREIKVWLNLRHDNVLLLLGTSMGFGRFLAMVCPWVENGALTSYLDNRYDSLSVIELLDLLNNVASGLQYLHSCSVVHGDLSGSNVLIHESGRACIADFGLSMLLTELGASTFATSFHARGTLRWTAPELLDLEVPEDYMDGESPRAGPTTQSDAYSFGSIMLQILSGKVPYHYYKRELQVLHAISKWMSPVRPSIVLVTERRWTFIQKCWSVVDISQSRPSSEEIVNFIKDELSANQERKDAPSQIQPTPSVRAAETNLYAPPLPVPSHVVPVHVHTSSRGHRTLSPLREPDEPETTRRIPIQPSPILYTQLVSVPNGWIPRVNSRTSYVSVPPPHELRRTPPPGSVTAELQDRRPTIQSEPTPVPPPVWSRDHAYQPPVPPSVPLGHMSSIGSSASTHISQYDLVNKCEICAGRARNGSQPFRESTSRDEHHNTKPRHSNKTEAQRIAEQWRRDRARSQNYYMKTRMQNTSRQIDPMVQVGRAYDAVMYPVYPALPMVKYPPPPPVCPQSKDRYQDKDQNRDKEGDLGEGKEGTNGMTKPTSYGHFVQMLLTSLGVFRPM